MICESKVECLAQRESLPASSHTHILVTLTDVCAAASSGLDLQSLCDLDALVPVQYQQEPLWLERGEFLPLWQLQCTPLKVMLLYKTCKINYQC